MSKKLISIIVLLNFVLTVNWESCLFALRPPHVPLITVNIPREKIGWKYLVEKKMRLLLDARTSFDLGTKDRIIKESFERIFLITNKTRFKAFPKLFIKFIKESLLAQPIRLLWYMFLLAFAFFDPFISILCFTSEVAYYFFELTKKAGVCFHNSFIVINTDSETAWSHTIKQNKKHIEEEFDTQKDIFLRIVHEFIHLNTKDLGLNKREEYLLTNAYELFLSAEGDVKKLLKLFIFKLNDVASATPQAEALV